MDPDTNISYSPRVEVVEVPELPLVREVRVRFWDRAVYLLTCTFATVTAIALIIYAVLKRTITPVHGAYLIVVLTLFALSFTLFLFYTMSRGGHVQIESNWGGLGGGLSGWSISPALTFLLLSIGFLALLALAVSKEHPQADLRERYRAALNFAILNGIKLNKTEVVGGKLLLKGTAPSQSVANEFWNQVKLANPLYDDVEPDLTIGTPAGGSGATGSVK
jgi:predicted lysophospholipase L1 biosynthesis ABC-type transport system permease subunit